MKAGLTRRALVAGLGWGGAGLFLPRRARGSGPVTLGLVLPAAGASAEQARLGAAVGLAEGRAFAEMFGRRLDLVAETAETPEGAARAAEALVRKAGAVAVAGALDDATAHALRGVAAREGALAVNLGARGDHLRGAACHPRLVHVQPSDAMYADALVQWLAARRKASRFALVSERSAEGEARRRALEAAVARAGGRLVSGPPADVRLLAMSSAGQLEAAREAKRSGGVLLAGTALDPDVFLHPDLAGVDGVFTALWYHETSRFSARELNRRFTAETGRPMQGLAWCGWAAVRLLAEAVVRTEGATPAAFEAFLAADYPFDGHKGDPLTLRPWDRQLRTTFVVLAPRGAAAAPGGPYEVLADNHPRDLDAAGVGPDATRCRLGG